METTNDTQGTGERYTDNDQFLVWKITQGISPCRFGQDKGVLIAHILVWEGQVRVRYGSTVYHLSGGQFAVFIDNSLLDILYTSTDIKAYILLFSDKYADNLLRYNPPMPVSFLLRIRHQPVYHIDAAYQEVLRLRLDAIRQACANTMHVFREKMIRYSIWLFLMDISDHHIRQEEPSQQTHGSERAFLLFRQFIKLLFEHAASQHFVDFYANRLNVTPQYLNRIVKAFSRRTVSGWIGFTLTGEINKRLDATDDTIKQIAADLNFADQATLAKFYKRKTGHSLKEYRKDNGV